MARFSKWKGSGYQSPKAIPCDELVAGEVGFLHATIKNVADAKVGDTITSDDDPAVEPLPGFEEIKPMVFAGLYPVESHEHGLLRDALEKLRLNDSAFSFDPETSVALGFGFRCGFLGLLHLEIVQERLEREFDINLITTAPQRALPRHYHRGRVDRGGQPHTLPGPQRHPAGGGAHYRRHRNHARGVPGRHPQAAGRQARSTEDQFEHFGTGRVLLTYEPAA